MPVNYDLLTNELAYQGLADLSVLVEDTSSDSPDYFRVSKLPKEFTAGKNTFHFKGNPAIFNEGSHVYIEILDANGQPLYYETALDLESAEQAAIVTVHVSSTTPPGTGYIIICSTIRNDIQGRFLDTSQINLRWTAPVYIDGSKRNEAEIIFDVLPEVTITPNTGVYTNQSYSGGNRFKSVSLLNINYYYKNDTPVLVTASNATVGFDTNSISGTVSIYTPYLNNTTPLLSGTVIDQSFTSSFTVVNSGIAVLNSPISLTVQNSISKFQPMSANVSLTDITYEMSGSAGQTTENSNNLATAFFNNLSPQTGEVSRIRSYYRSSGIGEYILSNETDITEQATEFGFNADVISASFYIPTVQRNDKLDFKFEFVNPVGLTSKQVVESLDNLFLGGNTYIGGDDNLLTGSLYVAGNTGTGVHISGKQNASMLRSIGYTGFTNGISAGGKAGFVLYSGSVQSILGASEQYSGVGLELVANSSSYFKYTTSGSGLLDIRTNKFFIGNNNVFLSSSNNNLEILNYSGGKTKFHLDTAGNVTASAFIAITGSSDSTSQYMMNTAVGLTDGKNIGRIIYHQVEPITIVSGSSSSSIMNTNSLQHFTSSSTAIFKAINSGSAAQPLSEPWLNYQPIISDLSYYSLPFENTITIFGNVYVDKYSGSVTSDNAPLALALRFTVWHPVTSSYDYFGLSGNQDPLVGDNNYVAGVSGSLSYGKTSGPSSIALSPTLRFSDSPGTGSAAIAVPFKAVINIPADAHDKISTIDLDYAFFKTYISTNVTAGTDFTYRAKFTNFTVMCGRTLSSDASSGTGDFAQHLQTLQFSSV